MGIHALLTALAAAAALGASADPAVFSIDAHVLSAGASTRVANSCYALTATIAEPVAGFSASTDYTLTAGFRTRVAGDSIFDTGFEDCSS